MEALVASADTDAVLRGLAVWNENRCEMCHDPVLVAKNPVKTTKLLEHLPARYDVAKMVTYLRAPQPPMPLFEMSDKERADLAAYLLDRFH